MKKFVAFALILSLGMFSVVGCGGTSTPAPNAPAGANKVDKPKDTKVPVDNKTPTDNKKPAK